MSIADKMRQPVWVYVVALIVSSLVAIQLYGGYIRVTEDPAAPRGSFTLSVDNTCEQDIFVWVRSSIEVFWLQIVAGSTVEYGVVEPKTDGTLSINLASEAEPTASLGTSINISELTEIDDTTKRFTITDGLCTTPDT